MPNNNNNNNMKKQSNNNSNDKQNVRSSTKRPRAPIACFRCHHKKVRCDGAHPNCIRCSSTGVLCAYPSSRRSRTTQPTNIDPFIDNLSHLEARIRRIESDLESQRNMVHSIVSPSSTTVGDDTANELNSKMLKTEMEVQDSRSILAQLRLRGEQRISKGKRAAAAAAAAAASNNNNNNEPVTSKEEEKIKNRQQQSNTKSMTTNKTTKKVKVPNSNRLSTCSISSDKTITPTNMMETKQQPNVYPNSFYFQGMMLDNNTDLSAYDQHTVPPGHGMDWTLFDHHHQAQNNEDYVTTNNDLFATHINHHQQQLMFPQQKTMMDMSPSSSRSSSLTSHLGYPVILQPSNSTTSTTSNATSATTCSSMNSCENIFGFPMDDIILNSNEPSSQDVNMLSTTNNNNNPAAVWYYSS